MLISMPIKQIVKLYSLFRLVIQTVQQFKYDTAATDITYTWDFGDGTIL